MIIKPCKIYAEDLDDKTFEQFAEVMAHPAVVQGALMPDAHLGYTLPIGGVVATKGMIFPSYVGYDIGCGMIAVPTTYSKDEIVARADEIFAGINRTVPMGRHTHKQALATDMKSEQLSDHGQKAFRKRGGFNHLGTLGSGNHFIEVGSSVHDDVVWFVIHSGSRGVGHGIAQTYMKLASPDGKAREGNYGFEEDSRLGQEYINDLNWCLQFALSNRLCMLESIESCVMTPLGIKGCMEFEHLINRNHNHAELKYGLWIHRKGATHAEKGMMGVVPGNMRDGSFIVCGKGNPDSLYSSSHGAGRVLGRKKAKELLDLGEFKSTMEGITAKVGESTLDEAPDAYKDIFQVMEQQKDLVTVVDHIRPLINIKA